MVSCINDSVTSDLILPKMLPNSDLYKMFQKVSTFVVLISHLLKYFENWIFTFSTAQHLSFIESNKNLVENVQPGNTLDFEIRFGMNNNTTTNNNNNYKKTITIKNNFKGLEVVVVVVQAGTDLGQAQLQLELGFTLIKVCCITLMITN